jgi:hypothetical protein
MPKTVDDPEPMRLTANRRWEPRMVSNQQGIEEARPSDLLQEREEILRRVDNFNHFLDAQAKDLAAEARLHQSAVADLESGVRKLKIRLFERGSGIRAMSSPAGGAIFFLSLARMLNLSSEFELVAAVVGAFLGSIVAVRKGRT